MDETQKIANDATATIGSIGIVITHDERETVIPWTCIKIKTEDLVKATE